MKNIVGNLIFACSEIWKTIGVAQKTSIILIILLTCVAIGTVVYLGSKPDWTILYSKLEDDSAAKVYELVKDEDVPVRLRDAGRTILVPSKHVNRLRLKVAREGVAINRDADGWRLFDNLKLGMTEKQQEIHFQRAVQGELQRMIGEIPGVALARVMLAIPRRRPFQSESQQRPSASVLVTLQPGHLLTSSQVASIRHMVASAVDGLGPQDVNVTDNHGTLLAKRVMPASEEGMDNGSQLEFQARMEQNLKQKAESILAPLVGAENVVAMVTVDVDFDRLDTIEERFDSGNAVVVNEKVVSEESTNEKDEASGVAGTGSNIVDVSNPEGGKASAKTSSETRKTVENSYIVPKTTQKRVVTTPRIRSISVAVSVAQKSDGGERSPQELEAYRRLVGSAVGAVTNGNEGRQDSIEVVESQFQVAEESPGSGAIDILYMALGILKGAAPLRPLLGFALLFVLYRIFRRLFDSEAIDSVDLEPGTIYNGNSSNPELAGNDALGELAPIEERDAFDLVVEKTRESPEEVASVLESLIAHDADG